MITDLRLQQFRSFNDASFELSKGVNIVVGPNASGKTNLLEAVLVLARGVSYRARDAELIQFSKPWARLDGHSEVSGQRTVKIVSEPEPSKTYEVNSKAFKRLTQAHSLPVVVFEPNHLQMLTGSPERRRDYLDDLLEQTMAGYSTIRRQYRRTLAQRNNLLKQPRTTGEQLFPWDVRLSQLGGQVARARSQLVNTINQGLPSLYRQLSQSKAKVVANYDTTYPIDSYESQLLKRLESHRSEDLIRGFTSSGPHREDLLITFDGHPIQEVASRGEVRTTVLALKIIELKLLEAARDGQTPLLLLDDVFSELDGARRHALTDHLAPYQTFITTTDADIVLKHFTRKSNVIALD